MAAIYPWDYIKDARMSTVKALLRDAKFKQLEARRWQEWLAFAPPVASTGQKPPTYKEFCNTEFKKGKPLPDTVIQDIRKIFKLGG